MAVSGWWCGLCDDHRGPSTVRPIEVFGEIATVSDLDDVKRSFYTDVTVAPKQITNFRIDSELLEALRDIRERDGLPLAEQVRRAIRAWVESKGIKVKAASRRADTRRKA